MYTIHRKDKVEIMIYGEDQTFTKEDVIDLWEQEQIIFDKGGVVAVWIEKRNGTNPLVHLMHEDDGTIYWRKEDDVCFDSFWLSNYIDVLACAKERTKNYPR